MNFREENQLFLILNEIADNAVLSQRKISGKTGLALSRVNYLMKKLSAKGMVKLKRASKNPKKLGYLYLLTTRGINEKSRLTYRFISRTLRQYNEMETRIHKGLQKLAAQGTCNVALYGAGETTGLFIQLIKSFNNIKLVGIVDDKKTGTNAGDLPLVRPGQLSNMHFDYLIPTVEYEMNDQQLSKPSIQSKLLNI